MRGANPESIPRFEQPVFPPACDSLCERCRHCIDAVDRAKSRGGRLRIISVCVAEHDLSGESSGTVIADAPVECGLFDDCEP